MSLSFTERQTRLEVYAVILALLPANPENVVSAIDVAIEGACDGLRQKLLEARVVAQACSCPEGLELLRQVLTEPPSALGIPSTDPAVLRRCIKPPNTAPEIGWRGRRDPMIKVQG